MTITATGWYRFWNYYINVFIDIYSDEFNPRLPFENFLANEQQCKDATHGIRVFLYAHRKYIAVVRMDIPNKTKQFFIRASGPNSIAFHLTGKNFHGEYSTVHTCEDDNKTKFQLY